MYFSWFRSRKPDYIMKPTINMSEKEVPLKKSTLLALIADKLKDRTLFPEKVEASKKILEGDKAIPA